MSILVISSAGETNHAEGGVFVACSGIYNSYMHETHTLTVRSRNAGSLVFGVFCYCYTDGITVRWCAPRVIPPTTVAPFEKI